MFLRTWAENFPYDFRDERMVLVLKEMGQLLIRHNLLLRRDVNDIFSGLHNRVCDAERVFRRNFVEY